jgi:lipoyl(octanoyl) transferase
MPLAPNPNRSRTPRVLSAYLLGRLPFDEWLALQRRLVYDVSGERSMGILVICEHPCAVSIGRSGSAADVVWEREDSESRSWPVRWVNRGGGGLLSAPGQIACYPIVALDHLELSVQDYLDRLHQAVQKALLTVEVPAEVRASSPGVWVGDRRIAHVGVSVRDWVTSFGCAVNVDPDLKLFHHVHCDGNALAMTSIERERRGKVRAAAIRQRLLAEFVQQFGFDRLGLFHHHPALSEKARVHAVATHPG